MDQLVEVLVQSRKEIIYAGSNNGILHAFESSNGNELWGYIPPNVLGNLEKVPSSRLIQQMLFMVSMAPQL